MRSKFPVRLFLKIFLRTPDLILPLTKGNYRKHRGFERYYKRADGVATKPPTQVSIRITNSCNHKCAICGQHGSNGYVNKEKAQEILKILPFAEYKKIIDEMRAFKPIYYITGGEPFLYPELTEVLNYAKKNRGIISLVTNGYKLKDHAEEIVKNRWDMVLVSLDGPEEIHDKCRGVRGAYQDAVNGITELRKWKLKLRVKKPYILTSTTLSRTNVGHLHKTFEICKDLKPCMMVIYLSWFTNEKLGLAQSAILKERLGVEAFTWKSYSKNFSNEEAELFATALGQIEKKKWPFEYFVIPDLKGGKIKDYYLRPEETFGYQRCIAPFFMIDIMPNGDVTTCRDFIDVKAGNITQNRLLDIWNNDKYVAFRKLLIGHNGLLPQCSRCCGLMGF